MSTNDSSARYIKYYDVNGGVAGQIQVSGIQTSGPVFEPILEETEPDWHWSVDSTSEGSSVGFTVVGTLTVFRRNRGTFSGVGWGYSPGVANIAALRQAAAFAGVDVSEAARAAEAHLDKDDS